MGTNTLVAWPYVISLALIIAQCTSSHNTTSIATIATERATSAAIAGVAAETPSSATKPENYRTGPPDTWRLVHLKTTSND
jgi:hypothetical protein